jgi:hypothetical protein
MNIFDQIELSKPSNVSMVFMPLTPKLEAMVLSNKAPYIAVVIGQKKYLLEHAYGSQGCAPKAIDDKLVIRWNCPAPFTAVLPNGQDLHFRDLTYQYGQKFVKFELANQEMQDEFEGYISSFQLSNPIQLA